MSRSNARGRLRVAPESIARVAPAFYASGASLLRERRLPSARAAPAFCASRACLLCEWRQSSDPSLPPLFSPAPLPHDQEASIGPRGVSIDASMLLSWLQMDWFLAQTWTGWQRDVNCRLRRGPAAQPPAPQRSDLGVKADVAVATRAFLQLNASEALVVPCALRAEHNVVPLQKGERSDDMAADPKRPWPQTADRWRKTARHTEAVGW